MKLHSKVSNPVWYCFKCGEYYPAGQPCPRCGQGDYVNTKSYEFTAPVRVTNFMLQSWWAHKHLANLLQVENHTERAALMHGVAPEAVTPKQRSLALTMDRAIGLGQVEF